jgi:hypothetical protein
MRNPYLPPNDRRPPSEPIPRGRPWWLAIGIALAAVLATLGLTALALLVAANAVLGQWGSNK